MKQDNDMNEISSIHTGTAVQAAGFDPFAAYGQEAAGNTGDFLKFSKGEWLKGQNDDEIKIGTQLVANLEDLSVGWIQWADKKPVVREMGLLAQGHVPARRTELGLTDQTEWEVDKDGKPQDPWSFTNELPVVDLDTGEQMTISMSSKGGIGAIGNLCKAYGKERAARLAKDMVPVIELDRDSYKHKEYGKTYVPVLKLAGWMENGAVPAQPVGEADDEELVAAAEKPAAKQATGSKPRF